MYEPYDYGDPMDEGGYRVKPYRRSQGREDNISSSRGGGGGGVKKPSRWVFISRKADVGIVLVLLLSAGLCIMWFISQLPIFVETAAYHYHWAKDVYATWGTPSMRWLFINVVVGVIVATSGLLSAFGGDSSRQQTDRSGSGYDKGVSYRGADGGVIYGDSDTAYNARGTEARFTGPGYESPLYNPYSNEPVRNRLHRESSFGAWNNHGDDLPAEEVGQRGREERHRHRGQHAGVNEPVYARPVDPEVMRAARPVSRQGSQRRGMPTPAEDVPMSREVPREMAFDGAPPRDMPREVSVSRELPREMPGERDMPPMEEQSPAPRETPVSREIPVPPEAPAAAPAAAEDAPPPPPPPSPASAPEPEVAEGTSHHVVGSRKEDAIEIISKVYDPVPEEGAGAEDGKSERLKTDPAIHFSTIEEASADRSSSKPEVLHKSHTFTLGRVIRRDQLADFIEPLSRKLEGIGRKVRDPHKRSDSHLESVSRSRDLPAPPSVAATNSLPVMQAAAIEAGSSSSQPETHRRRLSAEAIPVVGHARRLSSESVPHPEGTISHHVKQTSTPVIKHPFASIASKPSPPPSPLLKQRSIVYPPALLSQASAADEELSPPPSPPIEKAIPPPPPPHLKLPPSKDPDPSSSITSSEELPSFKFYVPVSNSQGPGPSAKSSKKQVEKVSSSEEKKPPSGKHSRTPSTHITSTSSPSTAETGSSSLGQEEQPLMIKPRRSSAGDEKVQEAKEEVSPLDKQDSPSGKDDDLHQQIEDFLARFHENWRLQRQESLARYKKRLVELDE